VGHETAHRDGIELNSSIKADVCVVLPSGVQYVSEVGWQTVKGISAHIPAPRSYTLGPQLVLDLTVTEAREGPDLMLCG
jgi:hypothetical protein